MCDRVCNKHDLLTRAQDRSIQQEEAGDSTSKSCHIVDIIVSLISLSCESSCLIAFLKRGYCHTWSNLRISALLEILQSCKLGHATD